MVLDWEEAGEERGQWCAAHRQCLIQHADDDGSHESYSRDLWPLSYVTDRL